MGFELRKLIRVRGSYLVYLPKVIMEKSAADEVEVFWEDRFVGVRPAGVYEAELACRGSVAVIVAGYAAGLDQVKISADPGVVDKALEKIYAVVEREGDSYVIKYVDKYFDKEVVVERMFEVLIHALRGVAKGTANHKTLQAADDESDRLRLTLNRLCAKRPSPRCAFYIQLGRFFERAIDHIVELYSERPSLDVWRILLEAAESLSTAVGSGRGEQLVQYLQKAPSYRFVLLQYAERPSQALHAARVLDYLINSAEVFLDKVIFQRARFRPGREVEENFISRENIDT
ncbi:MAG: hypothetical protein QXT27_06195 [Pyrobaculum sp.]